MNKKIMKYVLLALILVPIFMAFDLLWQWISKDAFELATAALQGVAMSVGFTLLQVYWDRRKK
ncbi:MAG: hypothetical protein J6U65_01675 [Bacteroidaceae bacterium]|nr:hypothetical protein [Bacteroidaceae bacterium]